MRRVIAALASLAVVPLLVPSSSLAIEPPVENGVGILCIFDREDVATANNVIETVTPGVLINLYFFIYNEQLASNNLVSMEFGWRFEPVGSVPDVVELEFPPGTLNIGTTFNVLCGFGAGVMTIDDHAWVMTARILFFSNPPPTYIYLEPPFPDSIDGEMAYAGFGNPSGYLVLKPNSVDGLYENPVFGLNMAVATEANTWGGVKSLFR